MLKKYVLLFLVLLFLVFCNKKPLEDQKVNCYFQCEYVNFAWAYNHSGFTITPDGEVFSFNTSTPWEFADNDKRTLTALRKNIEASVKIDTVINRTDIDLYQQLAYIALTGKLSEPVSGGADQGELFFKIIVPYTTNPQIGYHEVILTENGDFRRYNLSPEAAVISEWLSKLRFK
ncbi:MAG: hypothetical protein NTY07_21745 [Bacteroidia bacterium]|nr:hypothetical protein [Bacteroidia bacterium]